MLTRTLLTHSERTDFRKYLESRARGRSRENIRFLGTGKINPADDIGGTYGGCN